MGIAVLAHQGGWDEALLVAAPLAVFAGIVWTAKRRAVRQSLGDSSQQGGRPGNPSRHVQPVQAADAGTQEGWPSDPTMSRPGGAQGG